MVAAESIRAEARRRGVSVWQVRKDRGETSHPKADGRVGVGLRVSPELHERLQKAADDRGLSMHYLAAKAVALYLDNLAPADEFRLTR
jgi:predicted HicB family RNase H-like nuclease